MKTTAKDRQFSFVLSEGELAALHQVAEHAHQSAADFLRASIAAAHKAAGLPTDRRPVRNRSWGPRPR
jgi:hypothetical protein